MVNHSSMTSVRTNSGSRFKGSPKPPPPEEPKEVPSAVDTEEQKIPSASAEEQEEVLADVGVEEPEVPLSPLPEEKSEFELAREKPSASSEDDKELEPLEFKLDDLMLDEKKSMSDQETPDDQDKHPKKDD